MLQQPAIYILEETNDVSTATHKCKAGTNKDFATAILKDMGGDIDVEASLAYFEQHGGHCDCEILMNVSGTAPWLA